MKVLEGIAHPSIVRVYELLHDNDYFYIVTEYAEHATLFHLLNNRVINKEGALSEKQVNFIAV